MYIFKISSSASLGYILAYEVAVYLIIYLMACSFISPFWDNSIIRSRKIILDIFAQDLGKAFFHENVSPYARF